MWLGQGERTVVQGHHETSADVEVVGNLLGDVRQHARAFGAEPVHSRLGKQADEGVSLVLLEVGQRRAVADYDRGAGGSLVEEPGKVSCEIAGDNAGNSHGRHSHSGVQAVGSFEVFWPDQGLQPAPGVGIGGSIGLRSSPARQRMAGTSWGTGTSPVVTQVRVSGLLAGPTQQSTPGPV